MRQQAKIYIYLSPDVDTILGKEGKADLSRHIQYEARRRIKGIDPKEIDIVPSFAVQPHLSGRVVSAFLTFELYYGVSPERIREPIMSAVHSCIAAPLSAPGKNAEVTVEEGATFTLYP